MREKGEFGLWWLKSLWNKVFNCKFVWCQEFCLERSERNFMRKDQLKKGKDDNQRLILMIDNVLQNVVFMVIFVCVMMMGCFFKNVNNICKSML